MSRRSRSERGFTLVELLVSLALLGMTGALLAEGLHGGNRVWERVQARAFAADTVLTAQARLAGLLEGTIPETSDAGSRPFSRFEGDVSTVTFLADPDAAATGGVQLLGLALGTDGQLTISRQPDLATTGTPPPISQTPLIGGVERLELGYFGAAPPDNERRWRPRWEDQPTLPELIRVRVDFAAGDRRRWPELIVRPAATIDPACVVDASSGRCVGR